MLLMNTAMMIYIFRIIYNRRLEMMQGRGSERSQKADMICIYVRLFFGMGFIWYFEILSWAVDILSFQIFFDSLNMMQVVRGQLYLLIFLK